MITLISKSRDDTIAFGARLARRLKKGDVVALAGELGAGKTVLVKGIAKGLGVRDIRSVNSPSFVIVKEYRGSMPLTHFDIYRLDSPSTLNEIGYDEYVYGDGVTVIEWADKIRSLLPRRSIEITITLRPDGTRSIRVKGLR